MPADVLVLLGMPDIELLDILKILCKVMGDQQTDSKFDSQTIQQPTDQCRYCECR